MNAAKKLFAMGGFEGVSVKQLADEAGVNISLVSYHFGGKEGLYRACLESFGQRCLEETQRILQSPGTVEEYRVRVGLFIAYLLDVFLKEPELSQMAFKEADTELPLAQDIFQSTFLGLFRVIVRFFEDSKKEGILDPRWDSHTVASIFFGSLSHYARMDRIALKYWGRTIGDPQTRKKVAEHLETLFGLCLSGNFLTAASRPAGP